jgi:hypothetical protein
MHVEDAELDAVYEQLCMAFTQMRLDTAPVAALTETDAELEEPDGSSVGSAADSTEGDAAESEAAPGEPSSLASFDDGWDGLDGDLYTEHVAVGWDGSDALTAAAEDVLPSPLCTSHSATGSSPRLACMPKHTVCKQHSHSPWDCVPPAACASWSQYRSA